jgi:disulfide bond formation protein DsbB
MSRRLGNFAGFGVCVALMAYALYVQHALFLDPCPLCIFQRLAVIALGIVFLIAGLHNPAAIGARVYAALIGLVSLAGICVAARHVYIQHLPPDRIPACGAPLDQLLQFLPLKEVIAKVLHGDGECAKIDWTFLGLSMPNWVLIVLLVLGTAGVWNNLRRQRTV